jgi:prophage regulatory protein
MNHVILKLPAVLGARGRSRSAHYSDIQQGLYTPPVSLSGGGHSVGWPEREVETLNAARIGGLSDDEIRALVTKLVTARKELVCDGGRSQ